MTTNFRSTGAVALVASGIAAAFALAACCGLPVLFAAAGLSAYWLAPIASATMPHGESLTGLAVLALAGSVMLVIRAGRTCEPGDLCARPAFRLGVIMAAAIGTVLLIVSKVYA